MCIDYCVLNKITEKNKYPLPHIDDLFDALCEAQYFSKLDLNSAYHQVHIKSDDTHKSTFQTKFSHFEYLVVPFGLTNAPSTFQTLINWVLQPLLGKGVVV
jgi:hypothetical protein